MPLNRNVNLNFVFALRNRITAPLRNVRNSIDRIRTSSASAEKSTSAFGNTLRNVLTISAIFVGVRAINSLANSYSELTESVNAVNVVFGDAADTIHAFGERSATAIGVAQSKFNELATVSAAAFRDVIESEEETAQTTILLAQRAADLASVFNTDVSDAMLAINQLLTGAGNEALKRYGISIDDQRIKLRVFEMTGNRVVGTLTRTQRTLGALSLLLSDSANVQGDFTRTMNDTANSSRIAVAEFENLRAQAGGFIEETKGELASILSSTASALGEIATASKDGETGLSSFGVVVRTFTTGVITLISALNVLFSLIRDGIPSLVNITRARIGETITNAGESLGVLSPEEAERRRAETDQLRVDAQGQRESFLGNIRAGGSAIHESVTGEQAEQRRLDIAAGETAANTQRQIDALRVIQEGLQQEGDRVAEQRARERGTGTTGTNGDVSQRDILEELKKIGLDTKRAADLQQRVIKENIRSNNLGDFFVDENRQFQRNY